MIYFIFYFSVQIINKPKLGIICQQNKFEAKPMQEIIKRMQSAVNI